MIPNSNIKVKRLGVRRNQPYMSGNGKSLERLVASIEKALGRETNVKVESPKRLPDRTTRKLREHDVVLTIKQGHHLLTIAIECRDRSRPITVNQVEGFWAKCQDTGIDQGIIVSSMGFYNTARKKADHLGIRCLDIEEVESFNWLLAHGIHFITPKLIDQNWMFIPEEDGIVKNENMEILIRDGNPISHAILTSIAQQQLDNVLPKPPKPVERSELILRFSGDSLILRNSETNMTTPAKLVIAKLQYTVTDEVIPFRLMQYKDKDTDEAITDVAIAKLQLGENAGNLMIVYKEDKGGRVMYVPDKKKQNT